MPSSSRARTQSGRGRPISGKAQTFLFSRSMGTRSRATGCPSAGVAVSVKAQPFPLRPAPAASPAPAAACAGLHRRAAAAARSKVRCLVGLCEYGGADGGAWLLSRPWRMLFCLVCRQAVCFCLLASSEACACCVQAEAVRQPAHQQPNVVPPRSAALAEPAAAREQPAACQAADMEDILKEHGACGVSNCRMS